VGQNLVRIKHSRFPYVGEMLVTTSEISPKVNKHVDIDIRQNTR
jgi:hypothetical protein